MNTKNNTELAEVEKTQSAVDAMAVVTLSPEKYTAEVYQPFKAKLAAAIDSVRTIEYDIKTTAGMAVAIKARAAFRDLRVEADKERKARKEPITKIGKLLELGFDQVEERITPLEELFDADIKAEEARKEAEKAAKVKAERERIEAIQDRMDSIRSAPVRHVTSDSAKLELAIKFYMLMPVTPETYEEFTDAAKALVAETIDKLKDMQIKASEAEAATRAAEQARIAEAERITQERAELARQRAENERIANAQAAERQRLADLAAAQEREAAELRAKAEANLQAEREAQAEAIRKEQAERDRVAAEVKAQLEAQQAAIAEQSRKLAEQQAAADERDRIALAIAQDAQRREDDHGPALAMNAEFDAERTRLQSLADQAIADSHKPATMEELVAAASDADVVLAAFNDAPIDEDDETFIDYEAIAWAYQKLLAYGVGNTSADNAMMLDRLNLMLLTAGEVAA